MINKSKLISVILCFFMLTSFLYGQQTKTEEENNMTKMKRFYDEVVNKGNLDLFDELTAPDFKEHEELPGFSPNREGVKQFFKMYRTAFPDLTFTVLDMAASGDKVWSYITMSGTQKGDFMGVPSKGKRFEIKAVDIVRFVDGKAVEHWGVGDMMTMMQQLGAMPEQKIETAK